MLMLLVVFFEVIRMRLRNIMRLASTGISAFLRLCWYCEVQCDEDYI